jgi:hypothetical protein
MARKTTSRAIPAYGLAWRRRGEPSVPDHDATGLLDWWIWISSGQHLSTACPIHTHPPLQHTILTSRRYTSGTLHVVRIVKSDLEHERSYSQDVEQ